jgi:hypothetical protein
VINIGTLQNCFSLFFIAEKSPTRQSGTKQVLLKDIGTTQSA